MKKREPRAYAGFGLRSTRRGALVVETEAARRMMERLREMKDTVAEQADDKPAPGTASAGR